MPAKIYVLIVHGIGKPSPGYSAELVNGLKREFERYLQKALKTKEDYREELVVEEAIWDGVLAPNQERLAELLKKGFLSKVPSGLRTFFSKIFSWITRPIFKLRTEFAAEAVSDILGYKCKDAYPLIQRCLSVSLAKLLSGGNEGRQYSIIAHSLGTVISSDYIYDHQKKFGVVVPGAVLQNFFTLGSPIALFALQYGVELFKSPIRLEDPRGQWINIFDIDDPIAYPLKNLNDSYDEAVHLDLEVNTGGFGVSHTRYFDNSAVHAAIAAKLAEDWLFLNGKGRAG